MIKHIKTEDFAHLAGMTRRGASKLYQRAFQDSEFTWRGVRLVIRQVRGRGGRAGFQYLALVSSLPTSLQQAWKSLQSTEEAAPFAATIARSSGTGAARSSDRRYHFLRARRDVHHLDIVMYRPDGTEAWPKAIAWLDLATNRIWLDVVLLGKGEGIRNADVIASFVRMAQGWGMPRTLYLDNGSEYRWSEFIDDALKLVERIDGGGDDRDSRIVRAKPYNAPAKAIEGIFRVLEYTYFRSLPGWAGGDRTNKKTAKVGRPTDLFADTIDDLRDLLGNCLTLYHSARQRGALGNRSPNELYVAAVAAGWQKVTIDPRELRTVFATSEVRRVRRGAIEYGGRHWTCDALARGPHDTVTIRVPKFETPTVLPVLDVTDKLIGFAEPVTRYPILDKAGAREASRISALRRPGIRDLDTAAPDIDVPAEITRIAAALPPPAEAPVDGLLSISNQHREIAAGLAETADERADRQREKNLRAKHQRSAALERITSALNGSKP